MTNSVKIKSNRGYFVFLGLILIATGVIGIVAGIDGEKVSVPLIIGGIVLLLTSILAFIFVGFYIEISESKLIIKQFKLVSIEAEQISQIEWSWFFKRQGTCFINLKDGISVSISRKMFHWKFQSELIKFAERNGISQRGLDK